MEKFNSRETYLVYRSQWKSTYAQISNSIRLQRKALKGAQRAYSLSATYSPTLLTKVKDEFRELTYLKYAATKMLEELAEAKIEAGRQMMLTPVV